RLDVEVRDPVDRRTAPVVGAHVRRARQTRAELRRRAAQRPLEDSVPDEVHALGARALVVPAVARELLEAGGVESDVEEIGAIPIRAEHLGRDEARAGEIALVAENAIELERMA